MDFGHQNFLEEEKTNGVLGYSEGQQLGVHGFEMKKQFLELLVNNCGFINPNQRRHGI